MEALERARKHYRAGDLRDALEAAQVACERSARDPEAWWLLARIARHAGLPRAGDQAFARAAELSRRKWVPVRLPAEEFAGLVAAAQGDLSPDARRRLAGAEIILSDLPTEAEIRNGVRPDAISRRERRPVDTLTLYQGNLENRAPTPEAIRALVARTLARA